MIYLQYAEKMGCGLRNNIVKERNNRNRRCLIWFCTTTNRNQAVSFAQKVTERRKTGKATLNIYSVDENVAFEECSLLRFDNPDEMWLDFVAENRQGTYQEKQYDLIYGAVANDDVYRTITPVYDWSFG